MSADQPCTDCGDKTTGYTRAERILGIAGVLAALGIGYMALDVFTSGRLTDWLGRLLGVGIGGEAETYLKARANDRHG